MINRETAKKILETRGYPNPECDYENELLDTMVEYAQQQAKNNEVLDLVSKRELLNELINNQEEIISSPVRFNGVSIDKIKQVFYKNGVKYELSF